MFPPFALLPGSIDDCGSQNLAETTLWIQMVLSLLTVTISKPVNEDGQTVEPELAFTTGIVS